MRHSISQIPSGAGEVGKGARQRDRGRGMGRGRGRGRNWARARERTRARARERVRVRERERARERERERVCVGVEEGEGMGEGGRGGRGIHASGRAGVAFQQAAFVNAHCTYVMQIDWQELLFLTCAYFRDVMPAAQKFMAMDNVSNFIGWASEIGVPCIFESNDLIELDRHPETETQVLNW